MMNKPVHTPAASIKINEKFICIRSNSGYRSYNADPDVPSWLFELDATDEALGQALLDALSKSRQIDITEIETFFDLAKTEHDYNQWIDDMMARYGYKTKRALFKNMENCMVRVYGQQIHIMPMYHVKLDAWDGTGDKSMRVEISVDAEPKLIGQAIRLALSRCNP